MTKTAKLTKTQTARLATADANGDLPVSFAQANTISALYRAGLIARRSDAEIRAGGATFRLTEAGRAALGGQLACSVCGTPLPAEAKGGNGICGLCA